MKYKSRFFQIFFSPLFFGILALPTAGSASWTSQDAIAIFSGDVPVLQNFSLGSYLSWTILQSPGENFVFKVFGENGEEISDNFKSNSKSLQNGFKIIQLHSNEVPTSGPLNLFIFDSQGRVLDSRISNTLDPEKKGAKIAVCSCSRVGFLTQDRAAVSNWDRLQMQNPDAILFLGDIVYGDNALEAVLNEYTDYKPSYLRIEKKYIKSWQQDRIYHQLYTIPMFTIWDDHDFGYNCAGKENPYKQKMQELYRAFYPIPKAGTKEGHRVALGPGASYSFKMFGQKIIMLDDRTFYSEEDKIVLGSHQIDWLKGQLKNEPSVLLANGIPIAKSSPGTHSIEEIAPSEFWSLRKTFTNSSGRFLFLVGDAHYSEVKQLAPFLFGRETYQILSSGMHSFSPRITPPFRSGLQENNPQQLSHTARRNFVTLKLNDISNEEALSKVEIQLFPQGESSIANVLFLNAATSPAQKFCRNLFL